MAAIITSDRDFVVIEVEGVLVQFEQTRRGVRERSRKGRPGQRGEFADFVRAGALEFAASLARQEFAKHNAAEEMPWLAAAPVGCVAVDILGDLAAGTFKPPQPRAVQLSLFSDGPCVVYAPEDEY